MNISFGYICPGDPELAYSSLGFAHDVLLTPPEIAGVANQVNAAWQIAMKAACTSEYVMSGSFVQIGGPTQPYLRFDLDGTTTGTGAPLAAPVNCALLVKKTTLGAGKPGRGRMYLPGIEGSTILPNGVLTSTARSDYQESINEFIGLTVLIEGVFQPVLFHDETTTPSLEPFNILGLTVDQKIATQRRRMR